MQYQFRKKMLMEISDARRRASCLLRSKKGDVVFTKKFTSIENNNTIYNMTADSFTPAKHTLTNTLEETVNRPCKKQKFVPPVNMVAALNEIGISKHNSHEHAEAEKCYSQALCLVDAPFLMSQRNPNVSMQSTSSLQKSRSQEYDEGMTIYKDPLPIQESSDQEYIACALFYNVAQTQSRRSLYGEAMALFEKSLERCMGSADSNCKNTTVKILYNLGFCSYRMGHSSLAIGYYRHALSKIEEFGLGDVERAQVLNCIGVVCFHNQSDSMKEAMDVFKQSLAIYRTTPAIDLCATATVLNNMGRVHFISEEYNEALAVYDEALQIRRQALGKDSIDCAAIIYNKAQTHFQLSELSMSMELYNEFIEIVRSRFGPETPDVALAYRGMAEIYYEQSHLKAALYYFTRTVEVQRASLGHSHQEVACTLNKLGNLCYEMEDSTTALKFYTEGLKIEQNTLNSDHPHIVVTLTNIAHINKSSGKYREALKAYIEVKELQEKNFGRESLQVADLLCSIGLMNYHMKNFEEAFEAYQEALRIRRELHGTDEHPDIASNLNSIGLVLFKQEMFELAKECFSKSLRLRRSLLGPDHRDVAILFYNLATIYFEVGEDDMAVKFYKETLRIERGALGEDHPDVVLTLQHMAQVFQQLGHLDQALKYFLEALKIERKNDATTVNVAKILNLIGNLYLQLGNAGDMMKCYTEASRIFDARNLPQSSLIIAGFNLYGLSKINPPCAEVA